MQKPLNTNMKADLPENWQREDKVSPVGTDVGLTEQHGYNYLNSAVNDAHEAINKLNDAFENAQEDIRNAEAVTTIADGDTVSMVQTSTNTAKKVTFANIVATIRNKFTTVFAALVHSHGNMSSDGKMGSTSGQAVMTTDAGKMVAGTLPLSGGGTGASTASGARTNLGITPANIGAAPTSHNHDASNINAGTLSADRLPTVPVSKGGTGVTDLNVTKLKRDTQPDTLTIVYLSPSGNDAATGLSTNVPMKTIRAAVGKYGGLNRLQLELLPGTYSDSSVMTISGSQHVTISSTTDRAVDVIITHPIIFQSVDVYLHHVTFDMSGTTRTEPCVTLRQSKYNVQSCVFKHASNRVALNVSLGSTGYMASTAFTTGQAGVDLGSGASMSALSCTFASALSAGINVNAAMLISSANTFSTATPFTMNGSAVVFSDGVAWNTSANAIATATVEEE